MRNPFTACLLPSMLLAATAFGADWTQFRGNNGLGKSDETGLPTNWSDNENVAWSIELPGPGASSPIVLGGHVYVTCYSGYGLESDKGDQKNLRRHLLCYSRKNGETVWHKEFEPKLDEHKYQGEGSYHGYAASTPITDGQRLYIFFGKSGVYCFDLDGQQLWHSSVGDGINGWGSGCSPILYKNTLIVNASVESSSLVALDIDSGAEVWQTTDIHASWNTPLLYTLANGRTELAVSIEPRLLGIDPNNGEKLWDADGIHRYVCPSVVAHDGIVYAIGGGHTSLAVHGGGQGDVTESHSVWHTSKGSNVSSPIYHEGYLHWASGGIVYCQDAKTGKFVYQQRLKPESGPIWASPALADGKLYYPSQHNGVFVVAANPKYKLLAHNTFEDDNSRTNASPAISNGQIFLRTDGKLYCIE